MKKSTLYAVLVIIIFSITTLPFNVFASEGDNNEINLNINPGDYLFDIDNMKPGDWAPRSINVENKGEKDFEYGVTLENNGSSKLFNQVIIEISDGENNLYNGKMADFESLPKRELKVNSNEDLDITIRLPEHLGNEFQGLDVEFLIIFTAEGSSGETAEVMIDSKIGSDDEQKNNLILPKTATNIFTIMLVGAILLFCGGALFIFNKKAMRNRY